jgi:hypothetical protein
VKNLRSRISFSNVVAVLALFIALGGSAYAATQLKKNSVGTKQLKKNAVNGSKVKDQSLTGKDINLAKLGTVPSATSAANATAAGTASALTPPEAVRVVGAPGQPPFQNGASSATSEGAPFSFASVGFYKDHEGIVHLEGIVRNPAKKAGALFALPPGYRPASNTLQIFQPGEATLFIAGSGVNVGGVISEGDLFLAGTEEVVVLSGITFRAAS